MNQLHQQLLTQHGPEKAMEELERFVVWRVVRKWVCINGVWERNLTQQSGKTILEVYNQFKDEHDLLEER